MSFAQGDVAIYEDMQFDGIVVADATGAKIMGL